MHKLGLAKLSDLPALMKLFRRVNAELVAAGNLMWTHGYPLESDFKEDIENQCLYVLKEGSRVLAMGAVSHDVTADFFAESHSAAKTTEVLEKVGWAGEPIAMLHRFMADPAYQGKGVASELLDYLLSRYKGSTWIFAAYPSNLRAIRFYEKHGFTNYGIYKDFEWGPDSVQVLIGKKYKRDGLCAGY
jgi:ribosomal protein S18 acetylase RimI-like enzyme